MVLKKPVKKATKAPVTPQKPTPEPPVAGKGMPPKGMPPKKGMAPPFAKKKKK